MHRVLTHLPGTPYLASPTWHALPGTPLQGGAADLMTLAMLKLRNSKWLNDNGFTLLLQVKK